MLFKCCNYLQRCRLHGGDCPTAKKLWGQSPQIAPTGILLCHFWNVKCTVKIRVYHHASDKSCADFSLKCTKSVGGRALPGPSGGAYSAPLDLLAGFNSRDRDKGWRKGKDRRVWTAGGTGGQRKKKRGGRGEGMEKRGRRNLTPTVISKSRRLWLSHIIVQANNFV